MTAHPENLDPVFIQPRTFIIPSGLPGRTTNEDFVHFRWHKNINPRDYSVVVQSLDTAGPTYRKIGTLAKSVQLPLVQFGFQVPIAVIPKTNPNLPTFVANLNRGSVYSIPENVSQPGVYQMARGGVSVTGF